MRRFKKRSDLSAVFLPGVGRVTDGQVLEGEGYARYAPTLLVEIPAAPQVVQALVEIPAPPQAEPVPAAVPAVVVDLPTPPVAPVLTEEKPVEKSKTELQPQRRRGTSTKRR